MPSYAFDVVLTCALRVEAETEDDARRLITEQLDCADANLGEWPDGDPILAEVSVAEFHLFEIDGEAV